MYVCVCGGVKIVFANKLSIYLSIYLFNLMEMLGSCKNKNSAKCNFTWIEYKILSDFFFFHRYSAIQTSAEKFPLGEHCLSWDKKVLLNT